MMALVTAVIQLLMLVFKSWAERDAEKRKQQDELRQGWKEAVGSRDLSRINGAIDKLRRP